MGRRLGWAAATLLAALATPRPAAAFGGLFVSRHEGDPPVADAAMIVLAREGDHTVMTLRPDLREPAEDLALVVPIPSAIEASDVRVIEPRALTDLDAFTAPRLYDYFERDPCWNPNVPTPGPDDGSFHAPPRSLPVWATSVRPAAHFRRREYEMTILGESESRTVGAWLGAHGYHVPEGFEAAVRPHVERGDRFLVARVAADRLELVDGHPTLSPIRIHYRSDRLALPIALDRPDAQDLVVLILARDHRYDAASRPHATIPTHYRVDEPVRARLDDFYDALLGATLERHPGAVITEWAGEIHGLRPQSRVFGAEDLYALAAPFMGAPETDSPFGARPPIDLAAFEIDDALPAAVVERVLRRATPRIGACQERRRARARVPEAIAVELTISPAGAVRSVRAEDATDAFAECLTSTLEHTLLPAPRDHEPASVRFQIHPATEAATEAPPVVDTPWDRDTTLVLSRLHLRLTAEDRDEVIFGPADPITGGTYTAARGGEGPWVVRAARPYERDDFQARYFVGHPWPGHVACGEAAVRGVWGEPTWDDEPADSPEPGAEPTGPVALADAFLETVPELELTPRAPATWEHEAPPTALAPLSEEAPAEATSTCGCRAGGRPGWTGGWLAVALTVLAWRQRRGGNHCVP